jgi:hypothetical protein
MLLGKGKGLLGKEGGLLGKIPGLGLLKRIPYLGSLFGAAQIADGAIGLANGGDKGEAGKEIGGGAGTLAGTFAGAEAGASIGALGGIYGIAIGTAVGAAAGAFFGDKAGAILGGWLGKLDWKSVGEKITSAWDTVVGWFKKAADLITSVATFPERVIISGARAANNYVKQKTGVDVGASIKDNATALTTGRTVAQVRAARTGKEYAQGNISGLDDAHTRQLVASTAETESAGGNLTAMNKQGYLGRYQAGAGWLKDAGLLKGDPAAAIKKAGFSREWEWAESGGMSKFLDDDRNWADGMSKQKYLASAAMQDQAFKTNSSNAYDGLMKNGIINKDTPQSAVVGLLKARHLSGMKGAAAVARGGTGAMDSNGTTALKYFDDGMNDVGGYLSEYTNQPAIRTATAMSAGLTMPSTSAMPKKQAPGPVPDVMTPIPTKQPKIVMTIGGNKQDVSQDLRDRRIAHLATGGISGT